MLSFSRHILDSFEQMEAAMNHKRTERIVCRMQRIGRNLFLINDLLDEAEKELPNFVVSGSL